jgi:hypothetical protein
MIYLEPVNNYGTAYQPYYFCNNRHYGCCYYYHHYYHNPKGLYGMILPVGLIQLLTMKNHYSFF